jgi:Uma2 family endonuclease
VTIKERDALFPGAVITGELLEHLHLDGRYELVEGRIELLTPNNLRHAEAMSRISAVLRDKLPGWHTLAGDPGLYVRRKPDTVRGPDVLAISAERWARQEPDRAWLTVAPELVVEIISPSNKPEDLTQKVHEYLGAGVGRVWVVDLDARTVTVSDKTGAVTGIGEDELLLPNGSAVRVDEVTGS